jgi:hypothetical protein
MLHCNMMPAEGCNMFPSSRSLEAGRALFELGVAYQMMTISALEVIWRRTQMIAEGRMSTPDAMAMVLEKATVFAAAAEKATVAAARGGDPVRVASAALKPYGIKTRSNVRKLRR